MTINANLFAHIENDASLKGTFKLEGNKFERTVKYLSDYLIKLKSKQQNVPPEYTTLLNQLEFLVDIEQKTNAISISGNTDLSVTKLAQSIAENILNMPPDSKLLIPGGWHNSDGGHAMVYEFTPAGDGFNFTAVNAGAGLQYHGKKSGKEKDVYNPQKTWHVPTPNTPRSNAELIAFIERLIRARLPVEAQKMNKPIDEKVLYEEIFPQISHIDGQEIDISGITPAHVFTGGQLSGTCSQRCIHQMMKILTPEEKKYQEFIFDFKQYALYEYAHDCIQGKEPYNRAVAAQIRLAIENNLKILNIPGLFTEKRIAKELQKIAELEQSLKATPFPPPKAKRVLQEKALRLSIYSDEAVQRARHQHYVHGYTPSTPVKCDLKDGSNLLNKLNHAIREINDIQDPAIRYKLLEDLILQLPLNPRLPGNSGFYREVANTDDLDSLKKNLIRIQEIALGLQKNWLRSKPSPSMNVLLVSLTSLQMDVHTAIHANSNIPSFKHFSDAVIKSLIDNQRRNPFYATNHPALDKRLNEMQRRYQHSIKYYLHDYHSFLRKLVQSEPLLNDELNALYDQEFARNNTELHREIRNAGLKSLYLIERHYSNKSSYRQDGILNPKFEPIIKKVVAHMEHESTLRKAINPLSEVEYLSTVWFRLSIDHGSFRVSSPLFPSFVPNEKLKANLPDSKYQLSDSPAKDALMKDISIRTSFYESISPPSTNTIQLTPPKAKDYTPKTRNVTQADILARDYLHLRSVPTLQVALTLDYFKRNIEKLSDESNQRYVEANLFQPGLLLAALSDPEFLPQFDAFLKTGLKYFTESGQHQPDSLFFLRLDFLVSHYMFLNKNPEGLERLKNIQRDIEKQLSLPNKPETTYFLQQYLFLNLSSRLEQGEVSEELFAEAYKAYHYLNSHTNPVILQDNNHSTQLEAAMGIFKSIIQKQGEYSVARVIRQIVMQIEKQNKEDITIKNGITNYTIENKKTGGSYKFNILKGKIFEQGLARSGVPLALQNHPLLKELGPQEIKECLMDEYESYMVIPDPKQEVRLFYQYNQLTVQKHWTINGNKQNYQLMPLSKDHEAYHANTSLRVLITSLPSILKDGTMNYWVNASNQNEGVFIQNNIPVFAVRYGKIFVLDKSGRETGEELVTQPMPSISRFENNQFQLINTFDNKPIVQLPRYNLSFEVRDDGLIYHQETGEQIIDSPSPIHESVAGIMLASKEQQHYIVPVARFYATTEDAEVSDFYPVRHDISGEIAEGRLKDHFKTFPTEKKPQWRYPNSEQYVTFPLKDGKPIADSASDALYLAYIYMASNQPEKAWATLEECTTRFGGLTGNPAELQFIHWICNEMPHILPSEGPSFEKDKPKRDTPPYVACKLKATSLLCDYIAQNGAINLKKNTPQDGSANALYDSLNQEHLEQFQKSLPDTIYHSFRRLQTMGRHIEHTYTLSDLERKRLLDYYHQSQSGGNKPQGALGYEWLKLSLEALLKEQEALLARQTADHDLSPADNERLKLIQSHLKRLNSVVAKSSALELVNIDLSFPTDAKECVIKKGHLKATTIAQMDEWMYRIPRNQHVAPLLCQEALNELSSTMSDDSFINNFPHYFYIATSGSTAQRKELYNFCSRTLIANRHIPLKDQQSNIPLLCNVLHRLLSCNMLYLHYTSLADLIEVLSTQPVEPLKVYQAKDVYQEILATPEQIMAARERPEHAPLKATNKRLPSLLAQTKLGKHLSEGVNRQLQTLLTRYQELEQRNDQELNALSLQLDANLDNTFAIEEQAGHVRFATEQSKRELAQSLLENKGILASIREATGKAEPILNRKIKRAWQEALDLANQGPEDPQKARQWAIEKKSQARATLTPSDLLALYAQADFAYSVQKTGLSLKDAQRLHNAIHKALIHGIQYQSLQKINSGLEKAANTNDISIATQALDVLSRTEIPGLEEPSAMILQHEEKILLRKRQSTALQSLLKAPGDGRRFNETIEKIIMGGGKSKVILPILAERKAQGDNLVVVEVPHALLATNHVDLNSTSQRLFGKRTYRFDFDRDSDCSSQRLEQIYNLFIEIMSSRSYLVTTGEAVQSLELKYLELLLSEEKPTEEWKQQVYWCDKINNLFRHHTDCIIDEVHLGLSLKKKLNYTIGSPKPISASLIKNATALFNFIDLNIIKKAPSFDEHYDWIPFKNDLATKLLTDPGSPLKEFADRAMIRYGTGGKDELLAYLTNNASVMPESVRAADEGTQEALGFFKQEINVRLPQTLTQMLDKHYGPSKRKDLSAIEKTVAIPYAGTNVPNEKNRYQDELEAINKTIQMMLLKGISKEQLIIRVAEWEALAKEELFNLPISPESAQKVTIDDTPTAKGFVLLTQGLGLAFSEINSKNKEQMEQLHQRLQTNMPLMFDILREFSLKKIMRDSGILSSDNFNHAAQYRSVQGVSGTPPLNDSGYHQRLSYDKAPSLGTDGYIWEVIRRKNTQVSSHDNENTYQFISDVLSHSKNRGDARAFIDVRGAFTGVNNYQVAQEIARYIKDNAQHFSNPMQQVLYFNEDQTLCAVDINNPDKTIVLGTSDVNELNRLLDSTPEQRFTLYDQIHTFGTDIKQFNKAHAIVFADDKTNMQEFLQGAMRQRELDLNQTIELVVPARMDGITLDELGNKFKKNDKQSVTTDAPSAAQGLIRNHIRRQFLNMIQDLPSEEAEKKAELTQHFRPLFEDKPSLDLFEMYGGINKKQTIERILGHYKIQMQRLWETRLKAASRAPLDAEINAMSLELEAIIAKAIPFCLAEYDVADNSFNAEVEVQKEVQKEVQVEVMKLTETFDPKLREEMTQDWPRGNYDTFLANNYLMNQIAFKLDDICTKKGNAPNIFSNNLYGSKNYAQTYRGQREFTDAFLKPVFLIWYQMNGDQLSAMIVTPQEAKDLSDRLSLSNNNNSWIATTQDTVVAGKRSPEILQQQQYQELREQVRFFNGELSSLSNQDTPLLWINIQPEQKFEFFEKNLMPYRPGSETKIHQLKTALTQAKSEGFAYIAKRPFSDLTQLNWEEVYPDVLPTQATEYKKLAEAFLYVNQNWQRGELDVVALQQRFNLPMNSLVYIDDHKNRMDSLKHVLAKLQYVIQRGDPGAKAGPLQQLSPFLTYMHSLSEAERLTLESFIGMTIEEFYNTCQCVPFANNSELGNQSRFSELSTHSIRLLNLLCAHPALIGKEYFNEYFTILAYNAKSTNELRALLNTANPTKPFLTNFLENAYWDDSIVKSFIELNKNLEPWVLLRLVEKSQSSVSMQELLKQKDVNAEVLSRVLRRKFLSEDNLLLILERIKALSAPILLDSLVEYQFVSEKVQDSILRLPRLPIQHINMLLVKNTYSSEQLLYILNHPDAPYENEIIIRVLHQKNLSSEGLEVILTRYSLPEYLVPIFKHPAATPEIRKQVLSSGKLSTDNLVSIIKEKELSAEELLLIINPGTTQINKNIVNLILAKEVLDERVLVALAKQNNKDEAVLYNILLHPSFGEQICKTLLHSSKLTSQMVLLLLANRILSDDDLMFILNNSSVCNKEICEAILSRSDIKEHHLNAIALNCQDDTLLEQIYNHPTAHRLVSKTVLEHEFLTPTVILNLLRHKDFSPEELSLIVQHPTACNDVVHHALLQKSRLSEQHLLRILAQCNTEDVVEQVYNHPEAGIQVREQILQHRLVYPHIFSDILINKKPTDNEVLLILKNPLVRKESFLYEQLNQFALKEEHFNEIINNHEHKAAMHFVYRHPSATQEVRNQLLSHPGLLAREIVRKNNLTDEELKIVLRNSEAINANLLEDISLKPSIGYEVLSAVVAHEKVDDYTLFRATNHRQFDLNIAHTILQRDYIPEYLLLQLARKIVEHHHDAPELWEQCIGQIINLSRQQNNTKELNTLFRENLPKLNSQLSLKILSLADKEFLERTPLTDIIRKAAKEDIDTLIALDKEFTKDELKALSQKNLNPKQIDDLLDHKAMNSITANVLFEKPAYSGMIKTWDWLNEDQLLHTIDKTKDYNSLKLALTHADLLSQSTLNEWMQMKKEQHRELINYGLISTKMEIKLHSVLEDFRLKSLSHAIKAAKDPSYEQVAQASFTLYQTLSEEVDNFIVNPKEHAASFSTNCKTAIAKAEPVLQNHRGYKQFFIDFINVVFAVTALFRNGNWRLFESKTDSMNTVNNVLNNMDKLIEESNQNMVPPVA